MIENKSGLTPVGFRVLVVLDDAADVSPNGLIHLPESNQQRQKFEQEKATVLEWGGNAFELNDWSDEEKEKLKPGAYVMICKYAGTLIKSRKDNRDYRLISDTDITCLIDEEKEDG